MSPLRLPVVVLVLLPTFWAPSTAMRSSTLLLARSHSVPPDAGAPITAWAASMAAQSAADAARVATLAAGSGKTKKGGGRRSFVPIAPGRQILSIPNYVARARLGTPAQTLHVAIDPSNDAAWVPCGGCTGCAASAPSFSPTQSSTYRPVRCGSPELLLTPLASKNPTVPRRSVDCTASLAFLEGCCSLALLPTWPPIMPPFYSIHACKRALNVQKMS
ncbi:protein ASPARTIC PROTEASE IN GUARD CELL 2-like [Panicum miliaceum]|uniref:Protein ASPARTIC PROTEASE IN GUARD CELL 2-like n=1 Tax=Panicum miliaceum TaxID=4540 RepID=A0A3L6SPM3_PANMI|nr:protein ASPARTIC PROTEASE IN GUARD CELL 2-like [Panicum miliaceum]